MQHALLLSYMKSFHTLNAICERREKEWLNVKIVNIVQKMTSRLAGLNSAEETIPAIGAITTTEWSTKMIPAKTVKNDAERPC